MKIIASLLFALVASGTAAASPVVLKDPGALPPDCKPLLMMPADAHGYWGVWARRAAIATCAEAREPVPVVVNASQIPAALGKLEQSIRPVVALYREAMTHGPANVQFFARYNLGMAYANFIVRARTMIPIPADLMTNGEEADHFQDLHAALEQALLPYARLAESAFSTVEPAELAGR